MGTFCSTIAQGATQEPAEMAALKLPGRAVVFLGTVLVFPAWLQIILSTPLVDEEKIDMPLYVIGNCPPSLFVAVYGFQRHAEE